MDDAKPTESTVTFSPISTTNPTNTNLTNMLNSHKPTKLENRTNVKFRHRVKGAIYGIKWSENGKYLCYVSDDRTVTLWKFTNAQSLQMVYRCYGHQGRVFDCWISGNGEYVVSISEDSTCRVWNMDGSVIDIFDFRHGAIWSVDVCFKNPLENAMGLYHVALGGADASIRLHYFLSTQTAVSSNNSAAHSPLHSLSGSDGDEIEDITIDLGGKGRTKKGPSSTTTTRGGPSLSSKSSSKTPKTPRSRSMDPELAPFQHHIDSKAFYQLHLPQSLFPNQEEKRKSRGKKRNTTQSTQNQIRMMVIDRRSRILFATASAIYRVSNISSLAVQCQWEQVMSLKEIFGLQSDESNGTANAEAICTMELCRDLFSDYGHYKTVVL